MTQQQAIAIAQEYVFKRTKQLLPSVKAIHYPGSKNDPLFGEEATWEIWLELDLPIGIIPRERVVYVSDETGEPWTLQYGVKPDKE